MAKKQAAQRARYTGAGEHYEGIPARDLTADELAALAERQRALVASGRLYALEDDGDFIPAPRGAGHGGIRDEAGAMEHVLLTDDQGIPAAVVDVRPGAAERALAQLKAPPPVTEDAPQEPAPDAAASV